MPFDPLRASLAPAIAPVVVANITTRRPYHDSHVFRDETDAPFDPFSAHPAFGNSYDWHSSVHSHWTALQLLAFFASGEGTSAAADVTASLRAAVARDLTAANVDAEARYLSARPSYERPYGWAWAMLLAAEAAASNAIDAGARAALRRLASSLADRAIAWLGAMPGPVRHGVHGNTAFALGLMLDAARALTFAHLAGAIADSAVEWFGGDRGYPAAWERSAHDFLSPGVAEADLMRRVLERDAFVAWWRAFIADERALRAITAIADVPLVSDGQIVHLHGLNLSRAGMLARIAATVSGAEADVLLAAARELYEASAPEATGHEYLSTHWLPTFAWDAASSIDGASA